MNCTDLAGTGMDPARIVMLVLLALALLVAGIALRRRTRPLHAGAAALLILCLAGVLATAPATGAQAAACPTPASSPSASPTNSLTIVQTSVNDGMSPIEEPTTIVGRVTNNGPDDTYVTAILVSISAVVKAPGAAAGTCDASDYILTDPRMLVGMPLAANGGAVAFSGAQIGFRSSDANQDACQGASVQLHYVTD